MKENVNSYIETGSNNEAKVFNNIMMMIIY